MLESMEFSWKNAVIRFLWVLEGIFWFFKFFFWSFLKFCVGFWRFLQVFSRIFYGISVFKSFFWVPFGILLGFFIWVVSQLWDGVLRPYFRQTWWPVSDCVILPEERSQTRAAWSFDDPRIFLPFFEKFTLVIAAFAPELLFFLSFGVFFTF